jgi:hypothetical protein
MATVPFQSHSSLKTLFTVYLPFSTRNSRIVSQRCCELTLDPTNFTDNDLLQYLGTKNIPANTPAEMKRWKEGLAVVIRELRASNAAKDVNSIARRISQYRREFLGDDTKIINLG